MSIKINEQHDTWDIIGRGDEIQKICLDTKFRYQKGGKDLVLEHHKILRWEKTVVPCLFTSFKVAHTTHNLENHYMGMAKCVYSEVLCQYRRMGSMLRLGVTWVSYIVTIMENRLNIH